MKEILTAYCLYILLLSFITFCTYGLDKRKAKKERRRISERTLLSLSLLGGALGGLIGMVVFRHKTAKEHWYFTLLNVIGIIVYVSLAIHLYSLI